LGTGGLVKAYTEAAKRVLANAITQPWIPGVEWLMRIPYEFHNPVLEVCRRLQVDILEETFDESVHMRIFVPEESEDVFMSHIVDSTRGQAVLSKK
jgi:putative IMPACT (imprinted ancient) family translation regulator